MRIVLLLGLLVWLGSCGGGGGGGGGGSPPVNSAPVFTSASSVNVPENATGTIYQATATDADGNNLTFSLGGPDAARFALTAAGALSFLAPPNFEAPSDANGDNVYNLTVTANDGTNQTTLNLAVTVTNQPDQIGLRSLPGYERPIAVLPVPGTDLILVAEEGGRIYLRDPAAPGLGTLYLTVENLVFPLSPTSSDLRRGLQGIALAPDFATSGHLYVFAVDVNPYFQVRRYGRGANGLGDANSLRVIAQIPRNPPATFAPYGGGLVFGPDGFLYVGVGSTNITNSPAAQNRSSLLGKILRLDVTRDDFPTDPLRNYGIPPGNPFAGGGGAPEILAYGVNDPNGFSFDGSNLLFSDNQRPSSWPQEPYAGAIYMLRPQDYGAYYGYGPPPEPASIPPVIHVNNLGGIYGGGVYRGPIPQLSGLYIFADRSFRIIYGVPANSLAQGTVRPVTSADSLHPLGVEAELISTLGWDRNGNLYLISLDRGIVHQVTLI